MPEGQSKVTQPDIEETGNKKQVLSGFRAATRIPRAYNVGADARFDLHQNTRDDLDNPDNQPLP